MLLSIDEAKVAEVLKSSSMPQYKVSKSEVMEPTVGIRNYASAPYAMSGTIYTAPLLVTPETKERLLEARRKIEESGVPLKSARDLTKEIDEMRGRR
jgi:hypothetical protein